MSRTARPRQPRSQGVDGLNAADPGVRLLVEALGDVPAEGVLLVCCGDLPGLGVAATRLISDVRERVDTAHPAARRIAVGPSIRPEANLPAFAHAIVWPRAHLGKDFTQQCLARGASCLVEGGRLWCAVRKQKGADSVADFMAALLGNVRVYARDKGYRLLGSDKEAAFDRSLADEVLATRYRIEDPRLEGLVLHGAPGVFSRRALDAGTAQLIDHVAGLELEAAHVVDLGAGVGPLSLWAARRWPKATVTAIETNLIATALCRENVAASGLTSHVDVLEHDGVPPTVGDVDLALVNPPTHADASALDRLVAGLRPAMRPGGVAFAVVTRPGRVQTALQRAGADVRQHRYARYVVLHARW